MDLGLMSNQRPFFIARNKKYRSSVVTAAVVSSVEISPWPNQSRDKMRKSLRSCLETSVSSQALQHNAGHGNVTPDFVGAGETLVTFAEAT
jgi:hypothetical protein